MTNQHKNNFSIEETVLSGWEVFKVQWKNLLIAFFAYLVATLPLTIIDELWNIRLYDMQAMISEDGEEIFESVWVAGTSETVLYVLFVILMSVWGIIIAYNFFKAMFRIYDGHKYDFSEMFTIPSGEEINHVFNYIITYILYTILVVIGCVLLIVPGIYFAIRYSMAINLVVDKKMSMSDAFAMSSKMTEGIKWKMLGFGLLQILMAIGIFFAGLVALIVGIIPAIYIVFGWCTFNGIVLYRKLYNVSA